MTLSKITFKNGLKLKTETKKKHSRIKAWVLPQGSGEGGSMKKPVFYCESESFIYRSDVLSSRNIFRKKAFDL